MAAIAGTSYGSNPNESTYETNTNNELNEIIGDLDVDSDVDVQDLFNDSDDGDSDVDVQGLFNEWWWRFWCWRTRFI